VRRCLVEVAQLIRPLSDLFAPAIAGRVGIAAAAEAVAAMRRVLLRPEPAAIPPMPPMLQTPADEPPGRPAVA